jgi:hypothetical protein
MANLMTTTKFVKDEILTELRRGNTDVLKDLPPVLAMSYGMTLQREAGGTKDPSPIDEKAVNEAMLNRIADTSIKEQLMKRIEEEKAFEEKELVEKKANEVTFDSLITVK